MSLFPVLALPSMVFGAALALSNPAFAEGNALSFALTGGLKSAPAYFGADRMQVSPLVGFSFQGLRLGGVEIGQPDNTDPFARGTGLRGAFRVLAARDSLRELAGLNDIKAAVELGIGLHHTAENWQVYGEIRRGLTGHEGIAGDLGANVIFRPADGFTLHAGPRASFGNARFNSNYFGITPAEALAATAAGNPGLTAYAPGGGLTSLGFEIGGYQAIGRNWGVTGAVRYDQLRGDAAASPIVVQGKRDQVTAKIGLTRNFSFRF